MSRSKRPKLPAGALGLLMAAAIAQPAWAQTQLSITTASPLPAASLCSAYSLQLAATGGTAPYFWQIVTNPPPGFTLSTSGLLQGPPPTQTGTASFIVRVIDSSEATATKSFSLATTGVTAAITSPSTLPAAYVGEPYSYQLAATGTGTAQWSIAIGASLPAGLSFNSSGLISGTPSAQTAQSFSFNARVTFGSGTTGGCAASGSFTLPLQQRALTITANPPLSGGPEVYSAFHFACDVFTRQFTASGGTPPYFYAAGTNLPQGLTLNASTGVLSGTPSNGTYSITIRAFDAVQRSASLTFTLTVFPSAGTITTTSLPAGTAGAPYNAQLTASFSASWSRQSGQLPDGLTLSSSGAITGTPTRAGTFTFTVLAGADGPVVGVCFPTRQLSITINSSTLAIVTASLPAGSVCSIYSHQLVAEGGAPPYTWSLGSGSPSWLSAASGVLTGAPAAAGAYSVLLVLRDSTNATVTRALPLTIAAAPSITTTSLPAGAVGTPYSQQLAASGSGGQWRLAGGSLPQGLVLSPSGTIAGTPAAAGTFAFTVQATFGTDSAGCTASRQLSITIGGGLRISTQALPEASLCALYSVQLTAEGGAPPYTWTIVGGNPGSLALSTGGLLSGAPAAPGSYPFTVTVRDSREAAATADLTLIVRGPAVAITTAPTLLAGTVGAAYAVQLAATGSGTPEWRLSSGTLPPGLTLTTEGLLSGTPTTEGAFTFTAQVSFGTGGAGCLATRPFSVTVAPRQPGLTIEAREWEPVSACALFSQRLTATGGTPPYTWAFTGIARPSGINLSSDGLLSGSPTAAGTFPFAVQVLDAVGATATRSFSITVAAANVQITTASPLPAGTVGAPYSQTLAATGTPSFSWRLVGGSLPAGIALSAAGLLSGTPTQEGTSSFTIAAGGVSTACEAQKSFSLVIQPRAVILTITTTSIPGATTGVPYSQTLAATGGAAPYTWSNTGDLPAGLTLASSGLISGIPTVAGTFDFTARVADNAQQTAAKSFSIAVSTGLSITTASLARGMVGASYSATLAAAGGREPYAWSITSGALPQGLSLNASTGVISGRPLAAGVASFTAGVSDASGVPATRSLSIEIAPAPSVSFTGLSATAVPVQQPSFGLSLAAPPPIPLTGRVTVAFTPNSVNNADDQTIRFANGSRTVDFAVAAGSSQVMFGSSPETQLASTGTTAGAITLTLSLQSGGEDVTPSPAPSRTLTVNQGPPVLNTVTAVRTGSGLEVRIVGYSTPRQMTQATFRFAAPGANLQSSEVTIPVTAVFTGWYTDPASATYGSQFLYVQPFTVQGDGGLITSVTVILTNQQGASQAVTANF